MVQCRQTFEDFLAYKGKKLKFCPIFKFPQNYMVLGISQTLKKFPSQTQNFPKNGKFPKIWQHCNSSDSQPLFRKRLSKVFRQIF
jgi:hypothetical protein